MNKDVSINNIKLSAREPYIDDSVELSNADFGKYTYALKGSRLENTYMSDYSYCGEYCIIQNAEIGKFVNIAAMVRIGATQHPTNRASLHHFTYRRKLYGMDDKDDSQFFEDRKKDKVFIGHDVWIGHGAVIMNGIKIGNGAVIGSGAVVTKDVEPYTVVVGVPAHKIKDRFTEEVKKKLEIIKWWEWDYEEIKNRFNDFLLDAEDFVEKYM